MLQVGDMAPDVVLTCAPDKSGLTLASLWKEGPAVLIFLRHLGCMFCREHVVQLQQARHTFEKFNTKVALITIGNPDDTAHFCADHAPGAFFYCLCDFDKRAYQAFGLARTNVKDLFLSPHIYARGFQAALHGHFIRIPKEDPFQLPGVFIVDTTGVIRYAHRHKDAADNPPNSELFAVLEKLQQTIRK